MILHINNKFRDQYKHVTNVSELPTDIVGLPDWTHNQRLQWIATQLQDFTTDEEELAVLVKTNRSDVRSAYTQTTKEVQDIWQSFSTTIKRDLCRFSVDSVYENVLDIVLQRLAQVYKSEGPKDWGDAVDGNITSDNAIRKQFVHYFWEFCKNHASLQVQFYTRLAAVILVATHPDKFVRKSNYILEDIQDDALKAINITDELVNIWLRHDASKNSRKLVLSTLLHKTLQKSGQAPEALISNLSMPPIKNSSALLTSSNVVKKKPKDPDPISYSRPSIKSLKLADKPTTRGDALVVAEKIVVDEKVVDQKAPVVPTTEGNNTKQQQHKKTVLPLPAAEAGATMEHWNEITPMLFDDNSYTLLEQLLQSKKLVEGTGTRSNPLTTLEPPSAARKYPMPANTNNLEKRFSQLLEDARLAIYDEDLVNFFNRQQIKFIPSVAPTVAFIIRCFLKFSSSDEKIFGDEAKFKNQFKSEMNNNKNNNPHIFVHRLFKADKKLMEGK